MDPASLHYVDRDARAAGLASVPIDLEHYISDAYKALSDVETLRVLRGLRHGVVLASIETSLRLAEWASAASPGNGVPFRSKVWTTVEMSSGTATLDPAPYRIIGARTTSSTDFEAGRKVSMEDVLIGETRWLDVSYDKATGEITAQGDDSGYDGNIWVPEQRFENPAVRSHFAQGHEVRLSDIGGTYPPPHLFHLTRLIDTVRQEGDRPSRMFWAGQAAFGAPFAYSSGEILSYESGDNWTWAVIESSEGERSASFLPESAGGGESALKSTGTTVDRFEPLVTTGSAPTYSLGNDIDLGDPKIVNDTTRDTDTIHLNDTNNSISAGDRLFFQIVNQDYTSFVVVESKSGGDLQVRGEVPAVGSNDWAYVTPQSTMAAGTGQASISVGTPFPNGDKAVVEDVVSRMLPPTLPYAITVVS